ncbi:hypothetical protein D0T53_01385 [Dysgonomonas sp. 216]|uniref:hypothetical protein n=1 Tax=Dysgonomonas sp. 216 TaxID=2302934 RepID=UPI0013D355B0|nr:hypothetical protein [Dysgonomonas sp. 216]NDW17567.1 hypothetical protein [Dysgonomonas sp. 216]
MKIVLVIIGVLIILGSFMTSAGGQVSFVPDFLLPTIIGGALIYFGSKPSKKREYYMKAKLLTLILLCPMFMWGQSEENKNNIQYIKTLFSQYGSGNEFRSKIEHDVTYKHFIKGDKKGNVQHDLKNVNSKVTVYTANQGGYTKIEIKTGNDTQTLWVENIGIIEENGSIALSASVVNFKDVYVVWNLYLFGYQGALNTFLLYNK